MEKIYKYIHYGKKGKILAKQLYALGCRNRNDLIKHIKSGKSPKLPNISQIYIKYQPQKRIKNANALAAIKSVQKKIKRKIIPVGSIRREEKWHSDIDLLIIVPKIKKLDLSCGNFVLVEGSDRHQKYILTYNKTNYLIDIFICLQKELPYMLFHYTGSKQYNIRTRAYAKKKGMLLNQYGLFLRSNNRNSRNNQLNPATKKIKSEKDLVKFLGISHRHPRNR
jgi:DNA polymerase/3'-5' exonuclease PolX